MENSKILYTWTGVRELREAGEKYPEFMPLVEEHIQKNFDPQTNDSNKNEKGDVRRVLELDNYDMIVVLVDFKDKKLLSESKKFIEEYEKTFKDYKGEHRIEPVVISDKHNYPEVYRQAQHILEKTSPLLPRAYFYFCLESGTDAMNFCWFLLGTTLSKNVTHFLRNRHGKIKQFDLPYNLSFAFPHDQPSGKDNLFNDSYKNYGIIGNSPLIKKALREAEKVAPYDVNVLLIGETGTGKEKFAEYIHAHSSRGKGKKKLVSINCATISSTLAQSTLFGQRKGGFTGANNNGGIFEEANKSTLFLDEIGECLPEVQAELLRVLQPPSDRPLTTRVYKPVGAKIGEEEESDVRIIAATNRDLLTMSREKIGSHGSFRNDLLFRISPIVIHIPPLRDRKEDILPLAEVLLQQAQKLLNLKDKHFAENTKDIIQKYNWPGNVRELYNAIMRGAVMSEGNIILPEDLGIDFTDKQMGDDSFHETDESKGFDLKTHLINETRKWLKEAIECTDSRKAAAKWLGLKSPQALDSKLRSVGMEYPKRGK